MEYTVNRVVRSGLTNDCKLVEGTIQLADYDADLNIVFPGGQKAVLQWRVEGPTLDICLDQPVDVFFTLGQVYRSVHRDRDQFRQAIGQVRCVTTAPEPGSLRCRSNPMRVDTQIHPYLESRERRS